MSEIDQAFIKAYHERHAAPPQRPLGAAPAMTVQSAADGAARTQRRDGAHAASDQGSAAQRVPTPHLHLLATTSWLGNAGGHAATAQGQANSAIHAGDVGPGTVEAPSSADANSSAEFQPVAEAASSVDAPPAACAPSPTAPVAGPIPAANEAARQVCRIERTLEMLEGSRPTEISFHQTEAKTEQTPAEARPALPCQDILHEPPAAPLDNRRTSQQNEQEAAAADRESEPPAGAKATSPPTTDTVEIPQPAAAETSTVPDEPVRETVVEESPADSIHGDAVEIEPAQGEAEPQTQPVAPFQPQWEVDQFKWPEVVGRLMEAAPGEIQAACQAVQQLAAGGQNVVAVSGIEDTSGATTLLLALAQQLAKGGLKVAMIDADFDAPVLAQRVGMRVQDGWEATLEGRLPLDEVAVASLADGVTLVPLASAQGISSTKASMNAAGHLQQMRQHYDVVLVDAGCGSENVAAVATTSDEVLDVSVLLAVDQRRQEVPTGEVVARLRHSGITSIQLGHTFVTA